MKRFLRNILIKLKLAYYTVLDRLDMGDFIDISNPEARVQHRQNAKLTVGVRKLVKRLRAMNPLERTSEDNLLCAEPYKKTTIEKLEELRVLDKLNKEAPVRTEDDLVNKVVQRAPIYAIEQELKEIRKAMTAVLRRAGADPSDGQCVVEMQALKARQDALKTDIVAIKAGL